MSNESESFKELMNDQEEGVYQLAPGLTSEEMSAIFFNEDALMEAPKRVYRLNGTNHRYYYVFDENGQPQFFTSVTTMIKFTMPTSPHLIKWIADMGYDESKLYAEERADYGTFMHIEISELLIARRYDTDKIKEKLKQYIEEQQLPSDFINHADELKKDILAFAQFMIEYKVKPLAIEVVLTHPTDGYAGAVDLVCEMTIQVKELSKTEKFKSGPRKGDFKEVKVDKVITAIVDFKSGRKGFYEEHEVQLEAYKQMVNHAFPQKPIERMFNWSPKAWRGKTPTFNLKDQTEAKSRAKLQYLVELARIEDEKKNNSVVIVEGMIDIDNGIDGNVTEMTLSDLVKKRNEEKDKPKSK